MAEAISWTRSGSKVAAQASDVVYSILAKAAKDRPKEELDRLRQQVKENYVAQADIRYAAARGWVDGIIQPHETRATLLRAFALATRPAAKAELVPSRISASWQRTSTKRRAASDARFKIETSVRRRKVVPRS